MKSILSFMVMVLLTLTGCGGSGSPNVQGAAEGERITVEDSAENITQPVEDRAAVKVLVAYFSNTGNTEAVATKLGDLLGADRYAITAQEPYTAEDLNYNNDDSRANREQNDPRVRPAIANSVENMADYAVVFVGYPIWWGDAPRIMETFVESYDFSGKIIIPFCTSGSSGIGASAEKLQSLTTDAQWLEGRRFGADVETSVLEEWLGSLALEL